MPTVTRSTSRSTADPVFVKAVNYIPWQHFAEVGRSFYDRDMRLIAEAHGNSIGVHAHVQSPHAYDAADAAGVLTFQDFPLQWFYDSGTETNPGFVEEAQHQIADMAYLLHAHPSVVYYACHNEPLRMFVPTAPGGRRPERDVGERHLDAALFATLQSIEDSRHVHEASGIGDDVHSYLGSLTGRNLYRVSELPAWFVSEYGFWTVGPQAAKYGDTGWPPTTEQMREWVSRLSFIGSTVGFAGMPERYPSLAGVGRSDRGVRRRARQAPDRVVPHPSGRAVHGLPLALLGRLVGLRGRRPRGHRTGAESEPTRRSATRRDRCSSPRAPIDRSTSPARCSSPCSS